MFKISCNALHCNKALLKNYKQYSSLPVKNKYMNKRHSRLKAELENEMLNEGKKGMVTTTTSTNSETKEQNTTSDTTTDTTTDTADTADTTTADTNSEKVSYNGPEPKKFQIAKGQSGDILLSSIPLIFRIGSGILINGYKISLTEEANDKYSLIKLGGRQLNEYSDKIKTFNRPEKPIELYEYEPCPFCKKVREAVSMLDLEVLCYPTPRNGPNYREYVKEKGGKSQFPYMIDPNTNTTMYESDDIIKYLFNTYGDGQIPLSLNLGLITSLAVSLSQVSRLGKGGSYKLSKKPEKPLIVYSYEGSPFCKVVREELCSLEIPYLLKTCPRGSSRRQELFEKVGHFQVPYIEDPNTGVSMFESADIIKYLNNTYATSSN